MALSRRHMARLPGCTFWRLCGSGSGEGFTPRPDPAVWAILAAWPDADTARDRVTRAPVFRRWRARAGAAWTLFLSPSESRGLWAGQAPFSPGRETSSPETGPEIGPGTGPGTGPVAALTRARIRPRHMARFWARVPDISDRIGADPDVLFKIGLGEVPWRNQITFSVWPDAAAMARFARTGAHAGAIRAVRSQGWFSEELYARFRVTGEAGDWPGVPPLAPEEAP